MNLEYGLFPKASNHEETAEVGWLLYSMHQHDEERVSDLISNLVKEKVWVKWRPIQMNDRNRKYPDDTGTRTYAAAAIQQKLGLWYGSNSKVFPDGTKM